MSQRITTLGAEAIVATHNAQRITVLGAEVIISRKPIVVITNPDGPPTPPAKLPARGGAVYADSYLEYDGRHAGETFGLFPGAFVIVTGGTTWLAGETLTLTASKNVFVATDLGNVIILHAADPNDLTTVRLTITSYTSPTVVSVVPNVAVPVGMRSVGMVIWDRAVDVVAGLDHLEKEFVSILADDHVVGSPNNASVTRRQVVNGAVDLGDFYAHVYVGLPYESDLETLDIDRPQGPTMKNTRMNVTAVGLMVEKTRPVWVGAQAPSRDDLDPLEDLTQMPLPDEPESEELITQYEAINVSVKNWTQGGRVFVRVVDPTPATILAAIPEGYIVSG